MPATSVVLRHRRPQDYGVAPGAPSVITRRGRELFARFRKVVQGAISDADADSEFALVYSAIEPAYANTGLAIASGSGAVGGTINGVTVTATWATSDTNACASAAAAINASANALVLGFVTANNLTATLTCTSVVAGNTVQVCGYNFTATTGTPAANVSGGNLGVFDRSGTDAQTATNLAAAINAMPALSRFVFAVPVSNVVRLFAKQASYNSTANTFAWPTQALVSTVPPNQLISGASTIVASGGSLVAGAFVGLSCPQPGVFGNAMTIAASGTGVTVLNAETRFQRGAGLNAVAIIDNC